MYVFIIVVCTRGQMIWLTQIFLQELNCLNLVLSTFPWSSLVKYEHGSKPISPFPGMGAHFIQNSSKILTSHKFFLGEQKKKKNLHFFLFSDLIFRCLFFYQIFPDSNVVLCIIHYSTLFLLAAVGFLFFLDLSGGRK